MLLTGALYQSSICKDISRVKRKKILCGRNFRLLWSYSHTVSKCESLTLPTVLHTVLWPRLKPHMAQFCVAWWDDGLTALLSLRTCSIFHPGTWNDPSVEHSYKTQPGPHLLLLNILPYVVFECLCAVLSPTLEGKEWQPTPVFLPGESQGWGSLVGCHLWGHAELDMTEAT